MAFLAAGEVNTAMWSVCFRQKDCGSLMCDFRVSQQADDCFAHVEIEPTQCGVFKGEGRPRSGELFETEKSFFAIWNNPLKWFLGRQGVFEANRVCWARGARWEEEESCSGGAQTHDFPSDFHVFTARRWTAAFWGTVSELISRRLHLRADAPSSWRLRYG